MAEKHEITLTEETTFRLNAKSASVIGAAFFIAAIAYANYQNHEKRITDIEIDRKERIKMTDAKFLQMEKLQYRMALQLKVNMKDIEPPEGE